MKNAIIQIDATPFKQWYQQHYGVELGQKKAAAAAAAEETKEETKVRDRWAFETKHGQKRFGCGTRPKVMLALAEIWPGDRGRSQEQMVRHLVFRQTVGKADCRNGGRGQSSNCMGVMGWAAADRNVFNWSGLMCKQSQLGAVCS